MMRLVAVALAAAQIGASAEPVAAGAIRVSGSVLATDPATSSITVGEVGPWRVEGGQTVVLPRTVRLSASTVVRAVERASAVGPDGWPGGFVERAATPAQVNVGDFVTVRVLQDGATLMAVEVWLMRPGPS